MVIQANVDKILSFTEIVSTGQSDETISLIYDGAIIRLYRAFEILMLDALVGAINNDTETVSNTLGLINFAAHESAQSKKSALKETGQRRIKAAGAWLKSKLIVGSINFVLS